MTVNSTRKKPSSWIAKTCRGIDAAVAPAAAVRPCKAQDRNKAFKNGSPGTGIRTCSMGLQFPWKMHMLMDHVEAQGLTDIVSWILPDGRCFKIYDKNRFETEVMPSFFKTTSFKSFQRNLNVWGFESKNIKDGTRRVMYHEHFRRGQPNLCQRMERLGKIQKNDGGSRQTYDKDFPSKPEKKTGRGRSLEFSGGNTNLDEESTASSNGVCAAVTSPSDSLLPSYNDLHAAAVQQEQLFQAQHLLLASGISSPAPTTQFYSSTETLLLDALLQRRMQLAQAAAALQPPPSPQLPSFILNNCNTLDARDLVLSEMLRSPQIFTDSNNKHDTNAHLLNALAYQHSSSFLPYGLQTLKSTDTFRNTNLQFGPPGRGKMIAEENSQLAQCTAAATKGPMTWTPVSPPIGAFLATIDNPALNQNQNQGNTFSTAVVAGAQQQQSLAASLAGRANASSSNREWNEGKEASVPHSTSNNVNQSFPLLATSRKMPDSSSFSFPCRARGMPFDHTYLSATFQVSTKSTRHGEDLICSYLQCAQQGPKFRYCAHCNRPVPRRKFWQYHHHDQHHPNRDNHDGDKKMEDVAQKRTPTQRGAVAHQEKSDMTCTNQSVPRKRPSGIDASEDLSSSDDASCSTSSSTEKNHPSTLASTIAGAVTSAQTAARSRQHQSEEESFLSQRAIRLAVALYQEMPSPTSKMTSSRRLKRPKTTLEHPISTATPATTRPRFSQQRQELRYASAAITSSFSAEEKVDAAAALSSVVASGKGSTSNESPLDIILKTAHRPPLDTEECWNQVLHWNCQNNMKRSKKNSDQNNMKRSKTNRDKSNNLSQHPNFHPSS